MQKIGKPSKISPVFIAIFFSVLGLILRFKWRAHFPLAGDELWQMDIIQRPFFEFVETLKKMEYLPYLQGDYFLIYPFWRIFGVNKWGLAIPHIALSALMFYLLYRLCQKRLTTVWGYIIVFGIVCFNQTLIAHAFEIRRYAALPAVALATCYLAEVLVRQNKALSLKARWSIGLFFLFVILFDTYGILMVFFSLCFCLFEKRLALEFTGVAKNVVSLFAFVAMAAAPFWLLSIFGPHLDYRAHALSGDIVIPQTFQFIPDPVKDIVGFLKSIFGNLVGLKVFYVLILAIPLGFLISQKKRLEQASYFLFLIILPISAILVMTIKVKYWFVQRQFIWVIPFFAILLGWMWESNIQYFKDIIKRK